METGTIRIGMLGAARIGWMGMVSPARQVDGVELHAVAARDPSRALRYAGRHGIPVTHPDYDSLLADPEVHAVYIPLPNGLHGEWTLRALEAGKHVLCEKPFASNAAEAAWVQAAALEHERVVMEAFHYRYHPLARRICESVAELGELRHIEAAMCIPLPLRGDIRYDYRLAGGATMNAGAYTANWLRLFAAASGDPALQTLPEVISAQARLIRPQVDRAMWADLAWPNGATGRIENSLWSHKLLKIGVRIEGSRGRLSAFNTVAPHFYNRLKVTVDGRSRRERVKGKATYAYQLEEFVRRIRAGEPYRADLSDAVENMALIDAIYCKAGLAMREPASGLTDPTADPAPRGTTRSS